MYPIHFEYNFKTRSDYKKFVLNYHTIRILTIHNKQKLVNERGYVMFYLSNPDEI